MEMRCIIAWTLFSLGMIPAILVARFAWEAARNAYLKVTANWFGWNEEEKHERLIAADSDRRRFGVFIITFAIAALAFEVKFPWWDVALIAIGTYLAMTMVAGLALKIADTT